MSLWQSLRRPQRAPVSYLPYAPEAIADALLAPGSPAADRKKLVDCCRDLACSPSGATDLEVLLQNGVRVVFDMRKGGAGYRHRQRLILLNRMLTPARTATELIHEATHARLQIEGRGADLDNDSRDEFVANILYEETCTYFREAVVGRELLHVMRGAGDDSWKSYATAHPLQMWFQLVHGAPYRQAPAEAILRADLALTSAQLAEIASWVRPYFSRWVDAYRATESAKWDIRHGRRAPIDGETLAALLSMSFSEQKPEIAYPRRALRRAG
jgi:hypothetical protein